jgi:hypothetical protein
MRRNPVKRALALEREWQRLCKRHLPVVFPDSKWRYSRLFAKDDPEQGWKLHLTATVLSANQVLNRVAPLLRQRAVLFKAPVSLQELGKLNSGTQYGFSQVGKFLTIYPKSPAEAVDLANKLHQLAGRLPGPAVPYDRQLRRNSSVYYRFGGFNPLNLKQRDGSRTLAIRDPTGRLVPDQRTPGAAIPAWLDDPFVSQPRSRNGKALSSSPLKSTFLAYEAIVQRGKGGVYRALDTSVSPMRLCVLKEGRKHGETDWDGRDGFWWAKHEQHVLASLKANSIAVPEVYAAFEVEQNYYLAMEYVQGQNLRRLLSLKRKRMEIAEVLRLGAQLAHLLERIHKAGWVWRDCKPSNIIVTEMGKLVPLDFEGACSVSQPDPMPWGTPGFVPFASLNAIGVVPRLPDDLYALGAVLHQFITGRIPSLTSPQRFLRRTGRRVPRELIEMTSALLSPDPELRPAAAEAARALARLT